MLSGRGGLCRPYPAACLGGHGVDPGDHVGDPDGPPVDLADCGGSHVDPGSKRVGSLMSAL